jgi:hypothetical protein
MSSHRFTDPRCEELDRMLAALSPRRELAYRMALSDLSKHCRGDGAWKRRIAELRRMMAGEGVDLAAVLTDAQAAREQIMGNVVPAT